MDKCVYTKCTEKDCVIIALYMGEGKVILGVKITRMNDSIMVSQEHYV